MLERELVSRHLPPGTRIAVAADPSRLGLLERAGEWSLAAEWSGPEDPGLVVVDLAEPDALATWTERFSATDLFLLLLPCAAQDVPLGRVVAAAREQGLHFLEATPVAGGSPRVAVVAARRAGTTSSYLTGEPMAVDEAATARLVWEWGLGGLAARAREAELAGALDAALAREAALEQRLADESRSHAAEVADVRGRLDRSERRLAKVEQSASFRLGSDLVGIRRRPIRGTGALVSDAFRMWRRRRARG